VVGAAAAVLLSVMPHPAAITCRLPEVAHRSVLGLEAATTCHSSSTWWQAQCSREAVAAGLSPSLSWGQPTYVHGGVSIPQRSL
jgi:hypothetical protein